MTDIWRTVCQSYYATLTIFDSRIWTFLVKVTESLWYEIVSYNTPFGFWFDYRTAWKVCYRSRKNISSVWTLFQQQSSILIEVLRPNVKIADCESVIAFWLIQLWYSLLRGFTRHDNYGMTLSYGQHFSRMPWNLMTGGLSAALRTFRTGFGLSV